MDILSAIFYMLYLKKGSVLINKLLLNILSCKVTQQFDFIISITSFDWN